eukprot:gene9639-13392_t
MDSKVCTVRPNQIIVNEYYPGQGIGPHVDRHVFEDEVITISLLDHWTMLWVNQADYIAEQYGAPPSSCFHVTLQPGSLCRFAGEARWKWMHCIPQERDDLD